jgi:hypothetical protein
MLVLVLLLLLLLLLVLLLLLLLLGVFVVLCLPVRSCAMLPRRTRRGCRRLRLRWLG